MADPCLGAIALAGSLPNVEQANWVRSAAYQTATELKR
jgi:hypothetical protein